MSAIISNINSIQIKSKEAYELLQFLSFLHKDNIPEKIIELFFQQNFISISDLKEHSLTSLHKIDIAKMANSLKILQKYSLIKKSKDKKNRTKYHTTQEIQTTVRNTIKKNLKISYVKKVISIFNAFIPKESNLSIAMLLNNKSLIDQLNNILDQAEKLEIYNNNTVSLYSRKLEYCVSNEEKLEDARKTIEKIETHKAKVQSPDNLNLARYYTTRGWYFLNFADNIQEATRSLRLTLKHLKLCKSKDLEEWLKAYNRLVTIYVDLGMLKMAMQYSNKAQEIINSNNGSSLETGIRSQDVHYKARARLLEAMGLLEEASKNAKLAIKKAKELNKLCNLRLSIVPPSIILGRILIKQNDYTKAYQILKVAKTRIKLVKNNKNNKYTLEIALLEALCESKKRQGKKALSHYKKALSIIPKIKTSKNIILYSKFIKAQMQYYNQNYKSAYNSYLTVEDMYKNLLQDLKIDEVSYLYKKLVIVCIELKKILCATEYMKKHIKIFGKNHKRSLTILKLFKTRITD